MDTRFSELWNYCYDNFFDECGNPLDLSLAEENEIIDLATSSYVEELELTTEKEYPNIVEYVNLIGKEPLIGYVSSYLESISRSIKINPKTHYYTQLKHPAWQIRRLSVFLAKGFMCEICGDQTNQLHIHHLTYDKKKNAWDYENDNFQVLCEYCHQEEHNL